MYNAIAINKDVTPVRITVMRRTVKSEAYIHAQIGRNMCSAKWVVVSDEKLEETLIRLNEHFNG